MTPWFLSWPVQSFTSYFVFVAMFNDCEWSQHTRKHSHILLFTVIKLDVRGTRQFILRGSASNLLTACFPPRQCPQSRDRQSWSQMPLRWLLSFSGNLLVLVEFFLCTASLIFLSNSLHCTPRWLVSLCWFSDTSFTSWIKSWIWTLFPSLSFYCEIVAKPSRDRKEKEGFVEKTTLGSLLCKDLTPYGIWEEFFGCEGFFFPCTLAQYLNKCLLALKGEGGKLRMSLSTSHYHCRNELFASLRLCSSQSPNPFGEY